MAVVVYKTAPRCKICQHPKRAEVDALLEQRARSEKAKDGSRINLEYVLAAMLELGVPNPNAENIKNHWGKDESKKHSYFSASLTQEDIEAVAAEQAAIIDAEARQVIEMIVPGWLENPRLLTKDEYLELVMNAAALEVMRKMREGKPIGATIDHGLKAVDSGTRRNANEAAGDLMRGLGGALGNWATKQIEQKKQPALGAGVIDVEPVAEEVDG